jgi:hypothetical protein
MASVVRIIHLAGDSSGLPFIGADPITLDTLRKKYLLEEVDK